MSMSTSMSMSVHMSMSVSPVSLSLFISCSCPCSRPCSCSCTVGWNENGHGHGHEHGHGHVVEYGHGYGQGHENTELQKISNHVAYSSEKFNFDIRLYIWSILPSSVRNRRFRYVDIRLRYRWSQIFKSAHFCLMETSSEDFQTLWTAALLLFFLDFLL